jgi:class 3 adenylate cyclase
MRCTRCGTELIPGKRFCHECGARAQIPCPHCGAVVDPQFRFCPDCGGALAADRPPPGAESPSVTPAASAPEQLAQRIPEELARKIRGTGGVVAGERKQVTVLFCDLTGSTEIAERLDPEEYRDLLDQYLDLVFAEIHRHEGVVNQLAGDGLMALFGAPIAHEDAPARALHAALAIQQALGRLRSNGRRLRARIGVHTGPVVVGTVGNDLKMDYTAIGDTTNLASRLQSLAEPGTILASETTQRLTRGLFELRRVGPFEVRGKREPVTAFQVLRPTEATSPMLRAKARGMTPWVARDGELAQLRDCFARLGGSLAQMVSVVGDPGSGKSRLLYEFKRSLEHENAILFEARCSSLTQSVPFAPWKEMLRDYFGLRGDEPAPVAREKIARALDELEGQHEDLPYICHALGIPLDQRDEPSAEHVSQGRFEAISRVVVASARKARAVVIIEDLHWIDEPSRESLERAVSALEETNLMIVVSHRPDYQPNWNVRAAFTQLHLLPLPEADARRILRAQAGGELPEALEKRILRKADGNPFFVEELTRALAEEEHFVRDGEQLRLKRPVDEIRIPDTVQELVGARLDRLTPEAKRVAQVASVFGRQFAREPLGVLLDGEGLDVGAQLQQLEQRGVIHRKDTSSEDEFRFGESFTQEVAYESLLLKERRQLHARIAELLEERFQRSAEPQYSLLAHHYARSEDKARALKALLAAAERAEALPSYREALKLYLDAWKMAEAELDAEGAGPEDFQRAALQATVGLGGVMVVHGMPRRSDPEKPIRRGRLLAERLGDADALARLTALHGMLLVGQDASRFQEGVALVEQGRAAAERAGLSPRATSIGRALAWIYVVDGRFDEALSGLRGALANLEQDGQREELSDAYLGARYFYDRARLLAGALAGVDADVRETLDLATRASNRTVQSASSATLAHLELLRGNDAEALRWADHALEIAEGIGNSAASRNSAGIALAAHAALGREESAQRYVDVIDRSVEEAADLAISSHLIVDGLLAIGDVHRAQRIAEEAAERSGGRLHLTLSSLALAAVLVRRGSEHWTDAERHYRRALELARELGTPTNEVAALLGLGEVETVRGEPGASRAFAGEALALAAEHGLGRYLERGRCLLDCSAALAAQSAEA